MLQAAWLKSYRGCFFLKFGLNLYGTGQERRARRCLKSSFDDVQLVLSVKTPELRKTKEVLPGFTHGQLTRDGLRMPAADKFSVQVHTSM